MAFTKVETAGINSTGSLNLNGPVLIGSGTSTGTESQTLQVTGGAYVSGNLGIGTTNPTHKLHVVGDARITGILTIGTGSITINGPTDTISGVTTINTASINNGPLAGFRNAIINGGFEIAQRGTSISSGVGVLTYTLDRWIVAANTVAVEVYQGTQTAFPYNYLSIVGSSGNTGVSIRQRIEAKNIRDLAGKQVTLSFYIYNATSNASTISVELDRANAEDNFSALTNFYSASLASTTNTDRQTVTVTLPAEARNGIEVRFSAPAITSGIFVLHTVQLEPGPVATPFERRPIGTELALCQRYFYSTTTNGSNHALANQKTNTSGNFGGALPVQNRFPVQMRTAPNVTTYTNSTRSNPGNVLVNGATASTEFSQGADTISHATWNNGALTNVGDWYVYYMDATAEL